MPDLLDRLDRLNRALPWSHNDHYLPWVLRQVPPGATTALDVGCGAGGLLRRLAVAVDTVDGIDRDPATAARAAAATADLPGVTVAVRDLMDLPPVPSYDVITAVAVLHHLPLEPALRRLRALLRPGGRLVVVGCHRQAGWRDRLPDVLAVPANPLVGALRRARAEEARRAMAAPTAAAAETVGEVRDAALEVFGSCRVRRRVFWRYSMICPAGAR